MLVSTNEIPLLKEQLDTPLSGFGGYLLDDEQTLHCLFWDFDHHIYHSIQTQEGFQFILQYRESSNAEAVLHSFLHQDNFNQLDETTLQKVSILLHGVDNIEEISQNMIMLKAVWLYIYSLRSIIGKTLEYEKSIGKYLQYLFTYPISDRTRRLLKSELRF